MQPLFCGKQLALVLRRFCLEPSLGRLARTRIWRRRRRGVVGFRTAVARFQGLERSGVDRFTRYHCGIFAGVGLERSGLALECLYGLAAI